MHLKINQRNPTHPLGPLHCALSCPSVCRERRPSRACAVQGTHRGAVYCVSTLGQVIRVTRRSQKGSSGVMSSRSGLPAPLHFCAEGAIWELPSRPCRATPCCRAMPRRSPDLPSMSAHLQASLESSGQCASCSPKQYCLARTTVLLLLLQMLFQGHSMLPGDT